MGQARVGRTPRLEFQRRRLLVGGRIRRAGDEGDRLGIVRHRRFPDPLAWRERNDGGSALRVRDGPLRRGRQDRPHPHHQRVRRAARVPRGHLRQEQGGIQRNRAIPRPGRGIRRREHLPSRLPRHRGQHSARSLPTSPCRRRRHQSRACRARHRRRGPGPPRRRRRHFRQRLRHRGRQGEPKVAARGVLVREVAGAGRG
mmetsp:Transcript_27389/g.58144  ORF Transcript_27389/g.58144 Transcript_27389/m.58144 type:complete len:200 (+) Transcript_27389:357-956(+)